MMMFTRYVRYGQSYVAQNTPYGPEARFCDVQLELVLSSSCCPLSLSDVWVAKIAYPEFEGSTAHTVAGSIQLAE